MGIPVPFLELPMQVSESSFAAAVIRAGCQGDMMGCPDRSGGHRLAWVVDDVDGHRLSAMETSLRHAYAELHTADMDLAKGRWVGTGRMLDGRLRSPALDAYIDVEDRFEAPWVHVSRGQVSLRLLPRSDMELFVDLGCLKKALRSRGVHADPQIRHHCLRRYDTLRNTLRSHVLGKACRDLGDLHARATTTTMSRA